MLIGRDRFERLDKSGRPAAAVVTPKPANGIGRRRDSFTQPRSLRATSLARGRFRVCALFPFVRLYGRRHLDHESRRRRASFARHPDRLGSCHNGRFWVTPKATGQNSMRPSASGTTRVSSSLTIASMNNLKTFAMHFFAPSIPYECVRNRSKAFFRFCELDPELFSRAYRASI